MTGEPKVADQQPAKRQPFRPRPILVEVASALLVVGGAFNLLISIDGLVRFAQQGGDIGVATLITIALATLTFGLGLAVRFGRAWLLTVNVVAVIAFLELLSQTPIGLLFGAIDVIVVLALFRERPWFEWMAEVRARA